MVTSKPVIEFGDPGMDSEALNRNIAAQVEARRARGDYPVNVRQTGPESLLPGATESEGKNDVGPTLDAQLVDLMMHAGLQEPQFTSGVPWVGPLVVAFRRLWNWMSTKWYVLPLMWAQSDVNIRTSVLLSTLYQQHRASALEIETLRARVDELERLVRAQGGDSS